MLMRWQPQGSWLQKKPVQRLLTHTRLVLEDRENTEREKPVLAYLMIAVLTLNTR